MSVNLLVSGALFINERILARCISIHTLVVKFDTITLLQLQIGVRVKKLIAHIILIFSNRNIFCKTIYCYIILASFFLYLFILKQTKMELMTERHLHMTDESFVLPVGEHR